MKSEQIIFCLSLLIAVLVCQQIEANSPYLHPPKVVLAQACDVLGECPENAVLGEWNASEGDNKFSIYPGAGYAPKEAKPVFIHPTENGVITSVWIYGNYMPLNYPVKNGSLYKIYLNGTIKEVPRLIFTYPNFTLARVNSILPKNGSLYKIYPNGMVEVQFNTSGSINWSEGSVYFIDEIPYNLGNHTGKETMCNGPNWYDFGSKERREFFCGK